MSEQRVTWVATLQLEPDADPADLEDLFLDASEAISRTLLHARAGIASPVRSSTVALSVDGDTDPPSFLDDDAAVS